MAYQRSNLTTGSKWRLINFLGCVVAALLYFEILARSRVGLTLDILARIFFAELNRWTNTRNCSSAHGQHESAAEPTTNVCIDGELERLPLVYPMSSNAIVSIVGYREDPTLYRQALQSYKDAQNCEFILAAIDGDEEEDEEMVKIFQQVYPERSAVLHLPRPLAESLTQYLQCVGASVASHALAVKYCKDLASQALKEQGINIYHPHMIDRLCVKQPHMHKKGIMFTAFVIALVIAEASGIEFVWTSDSDSWITSLNVVRRAVESIEVDARIGGTSTLLQIHNTSDSIITRLADTIYFTELYLNRSLPAVAGASDCQSGPCALFRIEAVEAVLVKWYMQTVAGHWMITNEDRHLTTRLLLDGWKVTFVSDVCTATEAPRTLRRYLLQQVRWARAMHIEAMHKPSIYLKQSPLLFFNAIKGRPSAVIAPVVLVWYICTGGTPLNSMFIRDLVRRLFVRVIYLILRHPYTLSWQSWLYVVPGQIFHDLSSPAISCWGFLTLLDDGWYNAPRAESPVKKPKKLIQNFRELGVFAVWTAALGAGAGRLLAETMGVEAHEAALYAWMGGLPSAIVAFMWVCYTD